MTSAIPQLGFIRVSMQRSGGRITAVEASETLAEMLATLGAKHQFVPDEIRASNFHAWCRTAGRTTDSHLVRLAEKNEARLVTLDLNLPGAFVIPL